MFALEGKGGVRGKPRKPGSIIPLQQGMVFVVLGEQLIAVVLRRPDECMHSSFWHSLFHGSFVIPNIVL